MKGDQRMPTKKHPIILPNVVYKIGANAIEWGLSPSLQRTFSPQQIASSFLPGRNIHHSIILISEMLQQAQVSGVDHILIKMAIVKAFSQAGMAICDGGYREITTTF